MKSSAGHRLGSTETEMVGDMAAGSKGDPAGDENDADRLENEATLGSPDPDGASVVAPGIHGWRGKCVFGVVVSRGDVETLFGDG